MIAELTKNDAQEVLHKIAVLADTIELQEDYGLTQLQADDLLVTVPLNGGKWTIPTWGINAVCGEMTDHCEVLADIATNARNDRQIGQSLQISKQAKRLREIFAQ